MVLKKMNLSHYIFFHQKKKIVFYILLKLLHYFQHLVLDYSLHKASYQLFTFYITDV